MFKHTTPPTFGWLGPLRHLSAGLIYVQRARTCPMHCNNARCLATTPPITGGLGREWVANRTSKETRKHPQISSSRSSDNHRTLSSVLLHRCQAKQVSFLADHHDSWVPIVFSAYWFNDKQLSWFYRHFDQTCIAPCLSQTKLTHISALQLWVLVPVSKRWRGNLISHLKGNYTVVLF